jgi:hypothetical protein
VRGGLELGKELQLDDTLFIIGGGVLGAIRDYLVSFEVCNGWRR